MAFNGSGTFLINSVGNPIVTNTLISSTWANALTADLGTGLSTCITKDGQTATTARILFALGINSTLTTDTTSIGTGSILTLGGASIAKALWVGGLMNVAGGITFQGALAVTDTTNSTSIITGSITTLGGVGITKALWVGGLANIAGVATFQAQPILSTLTASKPVFTDASKGLVSTGTLGADQGGTGAATLTSNNVLLGNGTSAVQFVAPSTSGNILTSNGTTWTSTVPAVVFPISQSVVFLANNTYTVGDATNVPSSLWGGLLRIGLSATLGSPTGNFYGASDAQWIQTVDTAIASATTPGKILFRQSRGTIASPSNSTSSDQVGMIQMQGRVSGSYATIAQFVGSFNSSTSEGQMSFSALHLGSLAMDVIRFDGVGNVVIQGIYYCQGNAGFTGSGSYTSFSFIGGICTGAS